MTKPADVLARYLELRSYCDALSRKVGERFGRDWQCRTGCGGCCRLSTVCGLEAVVLLRAGLGLTLFGQSGDNNGPCILLRDDRCLIYENRPLICRTHGLPLVSSALTEGEVDCCPLNQPALSAISELERDLVLDLDRLTDNLMRLNLAFFLVLGRPELAEVRFSLAVLAGAADLPPELLAAETSSRQ